MIRILAVSMLVAVVAIAVRLPVCSESLWVDELHSAWAVWGGLQEVAGRAAMGNQTPWYFYVLWWWRQGFGETETALRFPSVLATALAATVLVPAVARHGGGLIGGAIAGLLMAVEQNAIFFGTEARPYAGVILAVACAAWAGVELRGSRRAAGGWVPRGGLLAACFLGFLWHPTAAIPLAVLVTILCGWPTASSGGWRLRPSQMWAERLSARHCGGLDYVAVIAVMLLALWINAEGMFRVWSDRAQWTAFGRPRSFRELWTIWPWALLVLVPLGCWMASGVATRRGSLGGRAKPSGGRAKATGGPGAAIPVLGAALLATAIAWGISCSDIAPIWHRRFLVGSLPLLCWAAGGFWGASLRRLGPPVAKIAGSVSPSAAAGAGHAIAGLVLLVAVGGLMFSQGSLQQIIAGNPVLVRRGEDWRGAVAFLTHYRHRLEPVLVAPELLESAALDSPHGSAPAADPPTLAYLRYPVSGPYRVEGAIPLGREAEGIRRRIIREIRRLAAEGPSAEGPSAEGLSAEGLSGNRTGPRHLWVLLRLRAPQALEIVAGGAPPAAGLGARGGLGDSVLARPFGGVTLLQISLPAAAP